MNQENLSLSKNKKMKLLNFPIMYQGYHSIDNRDVNYFAFQQDEAKSYGTNTRLVQITLNNPLLKRSDEYWQLRDEFHKKNGYYAEILDNSNEGLIRQIKFFEFLKQKGYDGITFLHEGIYFYPTIDSQYVITFTKDGFKEIDDIELAAGYFSKQLSKHPSENDSRVWLHNLNEILTNYEISEEIKEGIIFDLQAKGLYGASKETWMDFFTSDLHKSVQCSALTQKKQNCTRKTLKGNGICWQHNFK